jgi:hypothetical protein
LIAALWVLEVAAGIAGAPGDRGRLGLTPFQGHGARNAQAQVADVLEDSPELTLVDVTAAAAADTKTACAEAGSSLLLRGQTHRKAEVRLTILDCASGEPVDSFTLRLASRSKLRAAINKHVHSWLTAPRPAPVSAPPAAAPAAEAPPPVAAAEPVASTPDVPVAVAPAQPPAPPVPSAPSRGSVDVVARSDDATTVETSVSASSQAPRRTFLEVSAGGGTVSRWLSYNQDLFNAMSTYSLNVGPLIAGTLEAYPFAALGSGPLSHVGIVGQIQHSVGVSSGSTTGTSFPTTEAQYSGGLRARFWPGASEIGVTAGGGVEGFDVAASGGLTPTLPNYDYTFVSASADARVPLGSAVSILARGGYMQVLSNSLAQTGYFPRATAAGVDGQLGPAVALTDLIELRLMGEYRRYFFSMNPKPGDPHVAGGALDQYAVVTLQGAARFK